VLWYLGRMEALDGDWLMVLEHVVIDRCCSVLGWFGIQGAFDGWRIGAIPRLLRHRLSRVGWPGSCLFSELDFLFLSGAFERYGAPVLEWLTSRPCLVCRCSL
jgi:hypothetical protein